MVPATRAAVLSAGLLVIYLLAGCGGTADGYARSRPWRASVAEQVEQDVQAMVEGMRRAHLGRWN